MTDDARAIEALLADPTCCELACYEDPGCRCDGCKAVVGEAVEVRLAEANDENARLRSALEYVAMAWEAYSEAHADRGHPGQEHTRETFLEGGCWLCASARYDTEIEMAEYAMPKARAVLANIEGDKP